MADMRLISVTNLEVTFGRGSDRQKAVDGVSFSVAQGESFGIVGESGSGKSTILRALCGLAPVTAGTMALNDTQVATPRDVAFYRQVQMVFQDPYASLHPRHTVDTVLAEPLAIHGFDAHEARIEKALSDVGLGHGFRFRYPHQLSGGQRQRVAIARALILEPKVLLLDEPTSSIQAEVLNLLDDLRTKRGLTFILVSHDLAVVSHMCERLLVMQHGRIVEELTRSDLQARRANQDYTNQLLTASQGFKQKAS
jgi:peptide/nickel transport system ATP-binding protein